MPLCRLLEAQGASTVRLPAIEIRPCAERDALRKSIGPLQDFNVILFTSANAVRFGTALLDQQRDLNLAAIGPATQRALNQAGYRVAILPAAGFDSEGLLAHPRLQNLRGQRVLIVRGAQGRDLLERVLEERGAAVTACVVYERRGAAFSGTRLDEVGQLIEADALHVITATSLDIAASLLALGAQRPGLLEGFAHLHWLVPGERVAAGLRSMGIDSPLVQAASAEDQSLVDALLRWRSSVSGA
jgi:uroporphyrinogen-III synthase